MVQDGIAPDGYCRVGCCHFLLDSLRGKRSAPLTKRSGVACFKGPFKRAQGWSIAGLQLYSVPPERETAPACQAVQNRGRGRSQSLHPFPKFPDPPPGLLGAGQETCWRPTEDTHRLQSSTASRPKNGLRVPALNKAGFTRKVQLMSPRTRGPSGSRWWKRTHAWTQCHSTRAAGELPWIFGEPGHGPSGGCGVASHAHATGAPELHPANQSTAPPSPRCFVLDGQKTGPGQGSSILQLALWEGGSL